jgi:transcriptional regulator with XRE-family HTH domain
MALRNRCNSYTVSRLCNARCFLMVSRQRCAAVSLTKTLGANVRHYRKARGISQEQFADSAGLSTAMMGKIERGETAPSFDSVEKIAAALDVPEGALFATGPMTEPTGERGRLLQRINIQLSKLNNNDLARAVKMLTALTE